MDDARLSESETELDYDSDQIQSDMQSVVGKLKEDPLSITPDDARRLSENFNASNPHSARIISAVEALAIANPELHDDKSTLGMPHASILTLVKDLQVAVDTSPEAVTPEMLSITQNIVNQMQNAVGLRNRPHPELEKELQKEFAKLEPKVEHGTVTKAEANHLHSLEARAHGHAEKGGLTAHAQSIAAKRERKFTPSSGDSALDSVKSSCCSSSGKCDKGVKVKGNQAPTEVSER
ncbi:hypothetical protein BS50DRAFT_558660 [Corynespora cassiicola Philippines]|uniref:SMP domain-containing protein n=1 Tax=Corynespora cassiicola Philippines TaxID=1448308 RepID=A0A2T2NBW8_CORCC|nr:hypothetical protein BS50DRAFT_558660 [Corynespora cassiicola Philippines]